MFIVCRDLGLRELGGDSLEDPERQLSSVDRPNDCFSWVYERCSMQLNHEFDSRCLQVVWIASLLLTS